MAKSSDSEKYDLEAHYAFGENWRDFAANLEADQITSAADDLYELIRAEDISGQTFFDIGCGSGLHSLAALRAGAATVSAIDFDPVSVATAQQVIGQHWSGENYHIEVANILREQAGTAKQYDIVYSWGVLHHTGDMYGAISRAAQFVSPSGRLILAIYKKTPLCGAWRVEKKIYSRAPTAVAELMTYAFAGLFVMGLIARGVNPIRYIRSYRTRRGMSWLTDLRDWMGGYPYESAAPTEIVSYVEALGFRSLHQQRSDPPPLFGVFGSGCAEFVFERVSADDTAT